MFDRLERCLSGLVLSWLAFTTPACGPKDNDSDGDVPLVGQTAEGVDAGLFAQWRSERTALTASAGGDGSSDFTYSIEDGRLSLGHSCRFVDGLILGPVTVTVPVNITSDSIEVLQTNARHVYENGQDSGTGGGRNCSVALAEGIMGYRLEGERLLLKTEKNGPFLNLSKG